VVVTQLIVAVTILVVQPLRSLVHLLALLELAEQGLRVVLAVYFLLALPMLLGPVYGVMALWLQAPQRLGTVVPASVALAATGLLVLVPLLVGLVVYSTVALLELVIATVE
jgi:hypothetical protein